tara:strand:- start:59 stop:1246 length:1188 start_codon:yes stop_codon:yes gene_type:complete
MVDYKSPYLFELDIEVNNQRLEFIVSKLTLNKAYNTASVLTVEVVGDYAADLMHIGAVVRLGGSVGHGDQLQFDDLTRGAAVHPLRLDGIVRVIQPTFNGAIITITDMISTLATGTQSNYKASDYVGQDLYYLAKSIFDTFNATNTNYGSDMGYLNYYGGKYFDTDSCKTGSGILATAEMNLWGMQTPKQFLDKIFAQMYVYRDSDSGYVNEYTSSGYMNYKYIISHRNKVHFYYNNTVVDSTPITHVISEDRGGVMLGGVSATIDTSRLINDITVVSAQDSSIYAQHEDTNSVNRYGRMSSLITLNSTDRGYLQDQGYLFVERFKQPSYSYQIKTPSSQMFIPSDMIQLSVPSLSLEEVLPVEATSLVIENGKMETTVTVGERQLTVSELVKRL